VDTRRLILGDWTPIVRDGIDALRILLLLSAVVAFAMGEFGAGGLFAALGALTLVARLVELPRLYDLAFTVGMLLQGLGEVLGAYDRWAWFDSAVHVALPFFVAPVVYIATSRAPRWRWPNTRFSAV
jgi:hypothetical protein